MADNILNRMLEVPWPVVVTDPAVPASGDPVRYGVLTGIALLNEGEGGCAATETMVDFGQFVADHPVNDHVGGGVAAGDALFYVDAADRLENDSAGYFYGFALEAVGAGLTATIQVLHVPSPGAGTLGAGTIATANLAAGILSADAAGRAKMAAGLFDEATVTGKFAAKAITHTILKGGFAKMEVVAGQDETGDTTIPVTGMAAGDELVGFLVLTTAAAIATLAQRANTDFTVGAGNLTVVANAANNAANQYVVFWNDLT